MEMREMMSESVMSWFSLQNDYGQGEYALFGMQWKGWCFNKEFCADIQQRSK